MTTQLRWVSPPGWPPPPPGWKPPPPGSTFPEGFTPNPDWPPAPPGWQFWQQAGSVLPSCHSCGMGVAVSARRCPQCGAKNPTSPAVLRGGLAMVRLALLAVMLLLLVVAVGSALVS